LADVGWHRYGTPSCLAIWRRSGLWLGYPTWGNSESEIPDECKFHWVFMEMSLD